MTNFIPKWPSLPRLNDRSGFLSVSKRGIWLQYARSTKHSLYYNANKQYRHVCTRCFFDIKAVSTRLVTSKGIMYIKASNMVRLFNVKLTAIQSTIETQSAAYSAISAAYSAISSAYSEEIPQHIVRFPQHIVRFPQHIVRKFRKVQFVNLHLNRDRPKWHSRPLTVVSWWFWIMLLDFLCLWQRLLVSA